MFAVEERTWGCPTCALRISRRVWLILLAGGYTSVHPGIRLSPYSASWVVLVGWLARITRWGCFMAGARAWLRLGPAVARRIPFVVCIGLLEAIAIHTGGWVLQRVQGPAVRIYTHAAGCPGTEHEFFVGGLESSCSWSGGATVSTFGGLAAVCQMLWRPLCNGRCF